MSLDYLTLSERSQLIGAVSMLEHTHGVIPRHVLRCMTDPDLRLIVDAQLNKVGRVVIEHRDGRGRIDGYSTGYADDIAEQLAAEGIGVLHRIDRAALALVLLHCVAIPTAEGQPPRRWTLAAPVKTEQLHDNRPQSKTQIKDGLRRLRNAHIISSVGSAGVRPGPAFDRLTPAQQRRIEEDLLFLAAPHDPIAVRLRRNRTNGDFA
ncbi:hypothetical protein [Catellatospora methionotrophica]|uniref:hypothetical protein n=1 Tax=Catellatospora methionotrophica TaxID=121620 RepID=UPI0033EF29AB